MDEADGSLLEDADRRLVGFGSLAEAVALEAAMDGAARELGIGAAPHHLGDVVERQAELGAQFANQRFLDRREADRQSHRRVRAIGHRSAGSPAADGCLADTEFVGQNSHRRSTALNVGPDLRRRRGVGVQVQLHDARRSLAYAMPRSTPIPSNQSSAHPRERRGSRGDNLGKCSWP